MKVIITGFLLGACTVLAGCHQETGPERFSISGTVTYNGKPVPAGAIAFDPDSSLGNRGPAAQGEISSGEYQIESVKGILGGPMIVRIVGYDGVSNVENQKGNTLFSQITVPVVLPRENTTYDFALPIE